jgi:hypothetical protein
MAFEYLKDLGLPDDVEAKVRSLGASTPAALLSMVEHSRDKFNRSLGEEQTSRLYDALAKIVPQAERDKLKALPDFKPKMGALRPPDPSSTQNQAAVQKRDQLLKDIQLLRESGDNSPEKRQLLQNLEQQLRDVLKLTVATKSN